VELIEEQGGSARCRGRLRARGGSARRGGQAERGRRSGSKVSRFHGVSLLRELMACRRPPGGGTGDRLARTSRYPGLPPAGIDPPASRAARHRPASPGSSPAAMQLAVAAGRVDPGTGPITTLAGLVTTCIRADDRDGLPGPASPGGFLAQGTATYPAVKLVSEAAPADPASRQPRCRRKRREPAGDPAPAVESFPAAGTYPR